MKIIVDAMGGDNAPLEVVKGAIEARQNGDAEIILVGKGEEILRCFEQMGVKDIPAGVELVNATEVIDAQEDPSTAIRHKKDSSLSVALGLLRDDRGDALVSAGSTGALLSGATLIVKRVRGVRRAALAPLIPNAAGGFVLIDCGANTECFPEYLMQFAYMGAFYAQDVLGINNPRVGLLNNGTEETKGTVLQLETYKLLEEAQRQSNLNFIGNVEAKDAMQGGCDVLVCDGFTGNILLKAIEGTASLIMSEFKDVFTSSAKTKLGYLLVKDKLSGLKNKLNPDVVGGTPLLGISKPVIKAHGSSGALAITNAINQACVCARANIASKLQSSLGQTKQEL